MADDRDKRLRAERSRQRRRLTVVQRSTAAEVTRILRQAEERVAAKLAADPSDYQRSVLPALQTELQRALTRLEEDGAAALERGADAAWRIGIDQVDRPIEAGLAAGGVQLRLAEILPSVDLRQLAAMRAFLTDKIRDISSSMAVRVNEQVGLVIAGAQTPGEAVTAVHRIFQSGGVEGGRGRAVTIIRTELGRAYSTATQQRFTQARSALPGLKKQWRRSGKIHSRVGHDLADGQIREVEEPFNIGGVRLMYPRDPKAPPSETVNCGCSSLPIMDSWEVSQPGRRPFSEEELRLNPRKRDLGAALAAE